MTVKELIEALSNFPSDMRVCVDGYEDGANDPKMPIVRHLELNVRSPEDWYSGQHKLVEGGEPAVLIPRWRYEK